jgi:hypothetical protein
MLSFEAVVCLLWWWKIDLMLRNQLVIRYVQYIYVCLISNVETLGLETPMMIDSGGRPAVFFDVNDALRTSQESRDVYDMIITYSNAQCDDVSVF